MSSDFEAYEQEFGTLTAEITNKVGRIPKLSGEEKTQLVLNVDKQLEEVRELLEQMDLEVREVPVQSRAMYSTRLKSYKQEMEKLEKDFKRSRIAYSDEVRNELLGDDGGSSETQRAHLLDNTEKLERSSRRLEAGYQIAVETGTSPVSGLQHRAALVTARTRRFRLWQEAPCFRLISSSIGPRPPVYGTALSRDLARDSKAGRPGQPLQQWTGQEDAWPSRQAAGRNDRANGTGDPDQSPQRPREDPEVPRPGECSPAHSRGNKHTLVQQLKLRETDANLGKSSRVLTGMLR
ncbi:hypothetical protein P4O66_010920, partial [Electrophorus voltai]